MDESRGRPASDEILARRSAYIEWLQALCAIPSVSAEGVRMHEAADAVVARIRSLGGQAEAVQLPGAFPCVLAEFDGASDRTLLFYNHYDVQPPDPLEEWTYPPFSGRIAGGSFYARGAADNKGDLISRLAAIDAWKRIYGELPCKVRFLIEGEEEIGSPHLAEYVEAYADRLAADACVWEVGSRDPQGRIEISLGLKGIAYVELHAEVADVDLHSSYGAVIEAASNRLIRAIASLRDGLGRVLIHDFYDPVAPPSPEIRRHLDLLPYDDKALRESFGIQHFLRRRERQGALATLLLEPTCTVCGIQSGYTGKGAKTVLPRSATAKLDFRLVPNQTAEWLVDRLRHHLDLKGFKDVQIRLLAGEEPHRTPLDDPFVGLVRRVAGDAAGREIVIFPNSPGSGPMAPIAKTLDLPIVGIGTGYWDSRPHAPDEHIRLDHFDETICILFRLLGAFARF